MNVLWKPNYLYKILIIFLCLGLISGIVFYSSSQAEEINTSVTITICGNSIVETGEVCDDGNNVSGDGCSSDCLSDETCGNAIVDTAVGEECDDGNTVSGDGCSSSCQTEEEEEGEEGAPGGGGGGGGPAIPPTGATKVVLQGKASPAAYLTVLKDGQVLVNTQANSQGDFKVEISNISAGIYTFGVWAEDRNGLKSLTFSFTVNVISGVTTTVSGIFLPPTISLNRTALSKGETLNISGQTAPQAEVEIRVNSEEIIDKIISGINGDWFYSFDTDSLDEGIHTARARANTADGLLSTFSQSLLFGVGVGLPPAEGICPGADLDKDGKVNLIDFSILLYWWGRPNDCADQNHDGIVNLIDFSITLYYWTG